MCFVIPHFSSKETLSASSYLLDIISSKLSSSTDLSVSLFISVISLVLKCLSELVNCADYDQTVKDTFGYLVLCINKWISRVFSRPYGGGWRQHNSKTLAEFKVSPSVIFYFYSLNFSRFGMICCQ